MEVAAISDQGLVRQANEDSLLVKPEQGLFVVCDGMGGHKAGEVASKLAIDCIERYLERAVPEDRPGLINHAINEANQLVWQQGQKNPEWHEMGTTVTLAMIFRQRLLVANAGDSGLYLVRNRQMRKITRDHTLAQEMARDGLIKSEEIRHSGYNHILTRALGVQPTLEIDNFAEELMAGDTILLCSDGLTDMLPDDEILEVMIKHEHDINHVASELLDQALARGGFDNISHILLRV